MTQDSPLLSLLCCNSGWRPSFINYWMGPGQESMQKSPTVVPGGSCSRWRASFAEWNCYKAGVLLSTRGKALTRPGWWREAELTCHTLCQFPARVKFWVSSGFCCVHGIFCPFLIRSAEPAPGLPLCSQLARGCSAKNELSLGCVWMWCWETPWKPSGASDAADSWGPWRWLLMSLGARGHAAWTCIPV